MRHRSHRCLDLARRGVEFPIADRPITESEIDKLHSEAFRNLESGICDCTTMAKIAAQMVLAEDDGTNRDLIFAVCHVSEMLDAFKASYYAAWHGEKQRDAAP
jgi:hypothetical protein